MHWAEMQGPSWLPQLFSQACTHIVARGDGSGGGPLARQAHQQAAQRDGGVAALHGGAVFLSCKAIVGRGAGWARKSGGSSFIDPFSPAQAL